jgi:4a-hydroxytetrahydrobiopterin dehydratase
MSDGWEQGEGGLVRDWRFKDFAEAMRFVNRVAEVAEARDHHPDILVHGWNNVRLTLSTHSAGGAVTDHDRALADAIDAVA